METREIKIAFDKANEWFRGDNAELKELAIQIYPELVEINLPKTWEELAEISGAYYDGMAKVFEVKNIRTEEYNQCVFTTKEQAEASISCAMYSQLLLAYKDESIEDFLEIAKEYEPKVRPMLELFFFENATAAFYMGLLDELKKIYNDGWVADYNDGKEKYTFFYSFDKIEIRYGYNTSRFLSFKEEKTAKLFIKNFKELIEKAKPLL
jgi:hypothetical protein